MKHLYLLLFYLEKLGEKTISSRCSMQEDMYITRSGTQADTKEVIPLGKGIEDCHFVHH